MFVLMTAIIVLFSTQQFNFLDKDVKYRNEQIDGLRFFLSIFVVFHHYVLSESYFSAQDGHMMQSKSIQLTKLLVDMGFPYFHDLWILVLQY